jgi:hypothetical protein
VIYLPSSSVSGVGSVIFSILDIFKKYFATAFPSACGVLKILFPRPLGIFPILSCPFFSHKKENRPWAFSFRPGTILSPPVLYTSFYDTIISNLNVEKNGYFPHT